MESIAIVVLVVVAVAGICARTAMKRDDVLPPPDARTIVRNGGKFWPHYL